MDFAQTRRWCFGCLSALLLCVTPSTHAAPATNALILYDNAGTYGWLGEIHSQHLENLLNHFGIPITRKPLADYVPGDVEDYDATFCVDSVYDEAHSLPAGFLADIYQTSKTVVWMGYNLWLYARDPRYDFEGKYGLKVLGYFYDAPAITTDDANKHTRVLYKGQYLLKGDADNGLTHLAVLDPAKVTVMATCFDSATPNKEWPYIVRSGNFWVVPDMPMINTTFRNRALCFDDLLYDMLGFTSPEIHRAVLRIEDVAPNASPETLYALRDVLRDFKIPFTVSLIPEYRDWQGVYNSGTPKNLALEPGTPFARAIQALVDIGGQIVQHGTTHQIDGLVNPYDGVTAADYEFFKMSLKPDGSLIYEGPLPGQDSAEVRRRILSGHDRIKRAGFTPVGWLTPHYLGTDVACRQFGRLYPFALDRAVFFATDASDNLHTLELNSPFIYRDTHGVKRIPETIGYIDPNGWAPEGFELQPPSFPPDLIERARALKVVRNSWAGCYFHWYLNPAYLKDLVTGIKALGFEFVPVNGDLK